MSEPPHDREHLVIAPAFAPLLRAHGLDSLEALMRASEADDLSKPGLAAWRQRLRIELDGQALFIKRYRRPPLSAQLAARLRGLPAVAGIEWHWLHRLREAGIAAAPPVALGYRRRMGLECQSVLVTAAVTGRSLEQWARLHGAGAASWLDEPGHRDALLTAVAELVRRLHGAGLFHRDLYLSHLFFEPGADPAAQPALIDLHRMIQPRLRRGRWRVKDLAALNYATPTALLGTVARVRWFKRYRGARRLTRSDRALIRRVVAKTRRIARHDRRRRAALGQSG